MNNLLQIYKERNVENSITVELQSSKLSFIRIAVINKYDSINEQFIVCIVPEFIQHYTFTLRPHYKNTNSLYAPPTVNVV